MKITQNGKAVCGIVLPKEPTLRESFAAEELIAYIKKISGAELTLSDKFDYKIIVGEPAKNEAAKAFLTQEEFEKLVPGPEGFIIKADEKNLLIAGSSKHVGEQERGTVYGSYEFLERFLGCSLAVFSNSAAQAGEYVPHMADIEVKPFEYIQACSDVGYRTAIIQHGFWVGDPNHKLNEKFISWLAKNRYNRILTWSGVYEGYKKNGMLKEAEKRGILFSVGHHQAITMLLPHNGNEYFAEKYAETHPEYYKLLADGTRYVVKDGDYTEQLILCMRNEQLINQMAENIIKWSDANPQVDIISLWPHDGKHEQCQCELCRDYSKDANYSYFVNSIVEKVNKLKPNIKIDRIAYLDLIECDSDVLSSSVIIDEALWHEKLRTIGRPDGSCFADSVFEKNILEWKSTGATVVYYDYLMGNYGAQQKWMPGADEMQAVCKRFVEKGIYGLGSQMECYNLWNNICNFYTYGRTAYNTDLSMEDNLERFSKIFGGGSEYIKEIIRLAEEVVDGQSVISAASAYLINNVDKEKVYRLFEKALDEAKDKNARNNIRMFRMVFRYSHLQVRCVPDENGLRDITDAERSEIWYMHDNFDSFLNNKREGYGIAIDVKSENVHRSDIIFAPDKWYIFE